MAAHQRLAHAFELKGDQKSARRHLERLYEIQPDDFATALAYGRQLNNDKEYAAATDVLAPWSDTPDTELQFQLARSWTKRSGHKAISHYERCLELDPTRVEVHVNLGNLYRDEGDLEKAIDSYEHAIRVRPSFVIAHYNLSIALGNLERYREAISAGEKIFNIDPNFYAVYDHLGTMNYRLANYAEAVRLYERALELKPNFTTAENNLRRARAKL